MIKAKKYLIEKRKKIIFEMLVDGFSMADIARVLNVDRSRITHIVNKNIIEYKEFVKSIGSRN